ncbi:MAG: endonuclease III [Actinomycetota bacterium]
MPQSPRFLAPGGYDPVNAKKNVRSIVRALARAYGQPRTWLNHSNPFELVVATILSAQCTDELVNRVTPELFARYPTPEALAAANPSDVEKIIRPTGFFRQKTKSIIGCARKIVEDFGGEVPQTMEELTNLPGVARKTANVVLANCWPRPASDHGIFVDTHIRRVSQRLALTAHENPVDIERDLMQLLPKETWVDVPHQMILLGRGPCNARTPDHEACPLLKWCPTGQAAKAPNT